MSFIYAINEADFVIMSDTKITINDRLLKVWKDDTSRKLIETFGMIKTIIVSRDIVIAYAGNNIEGISRLLKEIEMPNIILEDVISIAHKIHIEAGSDAIEFVIGYYKNRNEKELISIKNNEVHRNCAKVWLGSIVAYREFMRLVADIPEDSYKGKTVAVIGAGVDNIREEIDEKLAYGFELEKIFRRVVESHIDDSVGGLVVKVKVPEDGIGFEYMGGIECHTGFCPQTVCPGQNIQFYQGVEQGSFCCNILQSSGEFCMYIYEDELGVIYTKDVCYADGLEGMRFPILYKNVTFEEFEIIASKCRR